MMTRNTHYPKTFEDFDHDSLGQVRKIIFAFRASVERRDKYREWIETGMQQKINQCITNIDSYILFIGNTSGWFKDQAGNTVILSIGKQLLPDVRTRRDSTFYMLRNFIDMRLVSVWYYFIYLIVLKKLIHQAIDSFLKSPDCHDIKHLQLFDEDWNVLMEMETKMELLSRVTGRVI
jgi:hypothetical protein